MAEEGCAVRRVQGGFVCPGGELIAERVVDRPASDGGAFGRNPAEGPARKGASLGRVVVFGCKPKDGHALRTCPPNRRHRLCVQVGRATCDDELVARGHRAGAGPESLEGGRDAESGTAVTRRDGVSDRRAQRGRVVIRAGRNSSEVILQG